MMIRQATAAKFRKNNDSGEMIVHVCPPGIFLLLLLILVFLLFSTALLAKPGTHGRGISTWDTTRSTVALMYHRGFILEGGSANNLSYNVNFTNTTGRLGSQFGLQYMNLSPKEPDGTLHGGSVSAIALYGIPMGNRYRNGLPKAALSLFFGAAPAVFSNGRYTYSTFPLLFGLGFEVSPVKYVTITPWVEGAPSFNFDTAFRYDAFQNRINEATIDDINIEYGPNGEIINVSVDDKVVQDLIDEAVKYEMSVAFRIRGGLSVAANVGDRLDFQFNFSVAQMGDDFDAKPTICIGGGLVFAWDDAPLGILPEETRAETLSCRAVEARYQNCGEYHSLIETTRQDERTKVEKECGEQKIIVHDSPVDTPSEGSDANVPTDGRPLSPAAVGISATELQSATTDEASVPADSVIQPTTPASESAPPAPQPADPAVQPTPPAPESPTPVPAEPVPPASPEPSPPML